VTFSELRTVVFGSHSRGDYQVGLKAIEGYEATNEDEGASLAFWRMCLLSLLGRVDQACSVFAQSLDEGEWWGPQMLGDSDFENVRHLEEWKQLSEISLQRASGAAIELSPIDLAGKGDVESALVLFHGAASEPWAMIGRFEHALSMGYRLICLRGDEPYSRTRQGWSNSRGDQHALRQLEAVGHLTGPVLVGFSQGAGLAAHLSWSGQYPCKGAVLFAPSFSIRGMPFASPQRVPAPIYLHVGTMDPSLDDARQVARTLQQSGVPVRLLEQRGLGHDWPDDLDQVMLEAMAWINENG